jgi:hypothetical protein
MFTNSSRYGAAITIMPQLLANWQTKDFLKACAAEEAREQSLISQARAYLRGIADKTPYQVTLASLIDSTLNSRTLDKGCIKQIGETLNEVGGIEAMQKAIAFVGRDHKRSIDFYWDGIGDWLA